MDHGITATCEQCPFLTYFSTRPASVILTTHPPLAGWCQSSPACSSPICGSEHQAPYFRCSVSCQLPSVFDPVLTLLPVVLAGADTSKVYLVPHHTRHLDWQHGWIEGMVVSTPKQSATSITYYNHHTHHYDMAKHITPDVPVSFLQQYLHALLIRGIGSGIQCYSPRLWMPL